MRLKHSLLLIPLLAYSALYSFWAARGYNSLEGDERGYLLISDSLWRDLDFQVENNYRLSTPILPEPALFDPWRNGVIIDGYSIHGVGLGILLVPIYAWRQSVLAPRLFMAVIAGSIPLLAYILARSILRRDNWALAIALLVSLSQPVLAASGQIYPDLPGGIILFGALVFSYLAWDEKRFVVRGWQLLLLGTALAILPWFHLRLALPLGLVGVHFAWRVLFGIDASRMPRQPILARQNGSDRPRLSWSPRLTQLLVLALPVIVSGMALAYYNLEAFGQITGPYGPGALSRNLDYGMLVLLGLHLDALRGLFAQAPHFLLGVVGLPLLWLRRRSFAIWLALLYATILIPVSLHWNWYGGASFAGRFGWAGVLLWCFPLLFALDELLARWPKPVAVGWFAMAALAAGLIDLRIVSQNRYLLQLVSPGEGELFFPAHNPLTDWLRLPDGLAVRLYPAFMEADRYLSHVPNWVAIAGLLVLVACGLPAIARSARRTGAVLAAYLGVSGLILTLLPGPETVFSVPGARLPSSVGAAKGSARTVAPEDVGLVTGGPFLLVNPGEVEIQLDYRTDQPSDYRITWACYSRFSSYEVLWGEGVVPSSAVTGGRFVTHCTVPDESHLEFRIRTAGGRELSVERLTIRPVP